MGQIELPTDIVFAIQVAASVGHMSENDAVAKIVAMYLAEEWTKRPGRVGGAPFVPTAVRRAREARQGAPPEAQGEQTPP